MTNEKMLRNALLEIQISAEDCASGDYPWPHKQNYSDIAEHAKQALSHVNETPKNEHDSGDVLKRAPLVRLTDEEINSIEAHAYIAWKGNMQLDVQKIFAHAIMDAMDKKNGG